MQQDATTPEMRQETFDFHGMIAELNGLLRLKTNVIGKKKLARLS